MWAFDTAMGIAYSFIIVAISAGAAHIWQSIASLIGMISAASLLFIVWARHKKRAVSSVIVHLLVDAMIISVLSGVLTSHFSSNGNWFVVGLICSLCFAAFLGFGIYCDRSKHMRAWIKKVFYI